MSGLGAASSQILGATVEDFALSDLNGEERRLSDFLAGKKGAVVLFWSGICSHCVRYDGYLNGDRKSVV